MTDYNFEGIEEALQEGKKIFIFGLENGFASVRIYCPTRNNQKEYGKNENLTLALNKASLNYILGDNFDKVDIQKTKPVNDILNVWVKDGNKLWAEKIGKDVQFEAGCTMTIKAEYSVKEKNFKTAYDSLCQLISENALNEAEQLR